MGKKYITPENIGGAEIKELRKRLGFTQKEFAEFIGSSKPSVERWEASAKPVTGPVVLLLQLLKMYPESVEALKLPPLEYPMRLFYMHNQDICTIIDIDMGKRLIKINNYTGNIMFRAFGAVEKPDYRQFEDFLESRCFPRTLDKMKLMLKELDLPFYDPLMIIEKTEGRMAEDDFWIRIER